MVVVDLCVCVWLDVFSFCVVRLCVCVLNQKKVNHTHNQHNNTENCSSACKIIYIYTFTSDINHITQRERERCVEHHQHHCMPLDKAAQRKRKSYGFPQCPHHHASTHSTPQFQLTHSYSHTINTQHHQAPRKSTTKQKLSQPWMSRAPTSWRSSPSWKPTWKIVNLSPSISK